jgi:hypothetical protein
VHECLSSTCTLCEQLCSSFTLQGTAPGLGRKRGGHRMPKRLPVLLLPLTLLHHLDLLI